MVAVFAAAGHHRDATGLAARAGGLVVGDDTGVTNAAEQAIATVIANPCGETCNAWAASMATGAMSTAVAEFEMNRATTAVTRNTTASMPVGPRSPRVSTR